MQDDSQHKDIDDLLNRIFDVKSNVSSSPLNEIFDQRLAYLNITLNQASKILDIDQKTLTPILSGESKKLDFVLILKLADFLDIPHEEIVKKYFQLVSSTYKDDISVSKKRSFIVNNFNLPSLKKMGFIDSINDFDHIEKRINDFFGFESIFEYSKHQVNAAFSSAKRKTNKENLRFWYATACESLEKTHNPHEYDRQGLIEYFPQIRWHSMNVDHGLILVAQALFKLGITVVFVPKFTSDLHVRAATIPYRDKPCIVLTQYTEFYGTIWWALIHELYHILYDWEVISIEGSHLSGELESPKISEADANRFARQYLFSDEKMVAIRPHINEPRFVKHFAEQNHVHPSIIYTFFSWDINDFVKYRKQMIVNLSHVLESFKAQDFWEYTPIKKVSIQRNLELYHTT